MITPSPTTKIDAGLARGVYEGMTSSVSGRPALLVFGVPNTSYQLHLVPKGEIRAAKGGRLIGTIHAQARRIDVVQTGGRFVEPVAGRPRRVQGVVVRVEGGAVVVDAGTVIHCTPTDPRQVAEKFEAGQLVSFDVLAGATYVPKG
ncbi:MAG: hypothetical protein IPK69_04545 [Phycisphaerales bacterium]|nr:MAG: hypothetical protein IPK69_04545 [Phycisphaerales bacterium]